MISRRSFLQRVMATASLAYGAVLAPTAPEFCGCGSGMKPLMKSRCAECATPDEINALLFSKKLRPCPHSGHSSDTDFSRCGTATGKSI
jgi:hypothetical protein